MSEPRQRQEELFEAALRLPATERSAFLDEACAGAVELRHRVEALLGAFDRAGGFMNQPAVTGPGSASPFTHPPVEKPGDKIGHYKLLEQIGEGGCGVVYVAEQEEPVRRRVALKVIKLGMDTKQVIARFDAERQALALMDHPNIAKVLDGGATDTGRPYFVMELVRGIRITDYCDQNHLPPRERLDLFIQVCRAIQHAHQKGIIHRDIKPSNILVTVNDGVAVPKVIDFGIAKATQGRLTDHTIYTAFEQFIGTPAYMSPEQAVMTSLDIDTRSDIYSLGVLLYELLTGKTPFDAKELLAKGLDEMRRTIREAEPVKPSTRLTQELIAAQKVGRVAPRAPSGENESSSGAHGVTRPTNKSAIPSDLDWIVMKCLEKDRARRYETANGLATDIGRHLNNEPIAARPLSRFYRFQKTVQRNKLAFGAATAVALALVIGLAVSTAMFFEAKAEKKKAQTEAAKSQQVAQFLKDMLQGADPWVALGRDTTVLREIADKTAERVGRDLTNQPAVEAELRETLGFVYFGLGSYEKAEAMHRQSLDIRKRIFGNDHPDIATSLFGLGITLDYRGHRAESETLLREALAIRRKLLGNEHPAAAEAIDGLAKTLRDHGKLVEAESLAREHLALQRKRHGREDVELGRSLYSLGAIFASEEKWTEAETTLREALTIQKKLLGSDHPAVALTLRPLGILDRSRGRLAQAEATLREALTIQRNKLGNDHPYTQATLNELAQTLAEQGRLAEAERLYREALAVLGNDDPATGLRLKNLAKVLRDQGRIAEAEVALCEAVTTLRKAYGNQHPYVGSALRELARMLENQGRLAEAESLFRETLSTRRAAYVGLMDVLHKEGKRDEEEAVYHQALAEVPKGSGNESDIAKLFDQLARRVERFGRQADAEKLSRDALAIRRRSLGSEHSDVAASLDTLAKILLKDSQSVSNPDKQSKLAEAEQHAREALAMRGKLLGDKHPDTATSTKTLASILRAEGKQAEAETLMKGQSPTADEKKSAPR